MVAIHPADSPAVKLTPELMASNLGARVKMYVVMDSNRENWKVQNEMERI